MKNLRILIADDHVLVRRGLRTVIETHPGWEICGEAASGRQAISKAEHLKPDVAILDFSMPDVNGLDATKKIRQISPQTEVLILSMHQSDQLVREIVDAGAKGYIIKSDPGHELVSAVEALAIHKPFFTASATEMLLHKYAQFKNRNEVPEHVGERLTPREKELVKLLAQGKSSSEAASQLGITIKTAETHRANLMRKLNLHSASELVRYAVRNNIRNCPELS